MLGILKTDTDAELKPVTPQAWQALSISPLYNRATKGDGGRVIWTDLCFDRKQFVAAFAPTHTPAALPPPPPEPTPRKQPVRERARRALNERYPDGVPDQVGVSDAELVIAVNAQIKKRGQTVVSRHTILRAAGRLMRCK